MATDDDIVRELDGTSVSEAATGDAIMRALNNLPSLAEEAADRSSLLALDGETILGEGIAQDDDYLAQLGLDVAKENLRNRLMAANPTLTAGSAELRVELATEAAYTQVKSHRYESDRLAAVTETLKAHAAPRPPTAVEGTRPTSHTFVRSGGRVTKA